MPEDPEEVTLRTKMKLRQDAIKNRTATVVKKPVNPIKVPIQLDFISPESKADDDYFKQANPVSPTATDNADKSTKGKKGNKKANIGIFLQNKQMKFGDEALVPEEGSKPLLVDYNAFKRGGNFLVDEEEELKK